MFLGGLWHGASYNFVLWGMLHAAYLMVQRLGSERWGAAFPMSSMRIPWLTQSALFRAARNGLQMMGVYACVLFAWIFFRISDFDNAIVFIQGIAAWDGASVVH